MAFVPGDEHHAAAVKAAGVDDFGDPRVQEPVGGVDGGWSSFG